MRALILCLLLSGCTCSPTQRADIGETMALTTTAAAIDSFDSMALADLALTAFIELNQCPRGD